MSLQERIASDLTGAMKAQDGLRTSVLRMAKAALKNREIDKKGALDDAETLRVLQTLVSQREDSAEQFRKGQRQELADKELAEIAILKAYLPAAASDEQVAAAIERAISETGASSAKDIGGVMKLALAELRSLGATVDGKKVNEVARRRLGG
jgi:uncharacterized protein YqeY